MARLPWTHFGEGPVQPGTLDGKPVRDDAHPRFAGSSLLKDVLVVLP